MSHRPGHRSLRKGRVSLAGQIYLATAATAGREPVFADFDLARVAARTIAKPWATVVVLSWGLMPDHFHALIELREGTLSRAVGALKGRTAFEVNRVRGEHRSVWARAFHDHALRREDDLVGIARYIICNPLRAGLVRFVRDYPFWDAIWLDGKDRG